MGEQNYIFQQHKFEKEKIIDLTFLTVLFNLSPNLLTTRASLADH